jgi:hypothetical protein
MRFMFGPRLAVRPRVQVLWYRSKLTINRKLLPARTLLAVCLVAPVLGSCGGSLSDYSLKDQEWFQRPGKLFGTKSLNLEAPPLNPDKPVAPDDLITAEGACPGMAPAGLPADANAQDGGDQPAAATAAAPAVVAGPVALGHTECDVARSAGVPNNVNISANTRGDRLTVLTYTQGPRPGIYTFTAGRLTSIERVDQPAPVKPVKPAKPVRKKKQAATATVN